MMFLINGLSRFNDLSIWVCKQAETGLIGLMMVIVLIQVFFRYVLNNSLTWPEETARFMMVWMTFLAAPIAYRIGANVSLDMLHKTLKGRLHTAMTLLIQSGTLVTIVILFQRSLGMIQRGASINATSLPITMTPVYICLPIGLLLTACVNLEMLLSSLVLLVKNNSVHEEHRYEFSGE
ncbi:TRAP transporter small permease [bacterium]|nr:TRAP transporter small permease [bacterium]